jgi:hypothetical protein
VTALISVQRIPLIAARRWGGMTSAMTAVHDDSSSALEIALAVQTTMMTVTSALCVIKGSSVTRSTEPRWNPRTKLVKRTRFRWRWTSWPAGIEESAITMAGSAVSRLTWSSVAPKRTRKTEMKLKIPPIITPWRAVSMVK